MAECALVADFSASRHTDWQTDEGLSLHPVLEYFTALDLIS